MHELRSMLHLAVGHGAIVRADGVAVALVAGGAPAWELLAPQDRARIGAAYHRLVCALDAPLDIYTFDEPPDTSAQAGQLRQRQVGAIDRDAPQHAAILGEMAGYLDDLGSITTTRGRHVIWAMALAPERHRRIGWPWQRTAGAPPVNVDAGLRAAGTAARRLADDLAMLEGVPAPQPLSMRAAARVLYRLADPVRARFIHPDRAIEPPTPVRHDQRIARGSP
ncbi:MAG: hypothetical protein KGS47_00310 [Chloroflexi bacterium]|jgi:hypothetical protein|nr:hypothetical protein [Chloroflexota bacterium]